VIRVVVFVLKHETRRGQQEMVSAGDGVSRTSSRSYRIKQKHGRKVPNIGRQLDGAIHDTLVGCLPSNVGGVKHRLEINSRPIKP
jgi:hypothetical protein